MLATLEELRIDALAYPTLRRKPALIGEAQAGTNCQLSATTGLPAIAMPAGFSPDGLPIALELLGGAWEEAKLLKYAYAWEQATKPRRPPFSTPPLVNGAAPVPTTADVTIGAALIKFAYDATTGALRYDAATLKMAPTDRVVAPGPASQRGRQAGTDRRASPGAESDRRIGHGDDARKKPRGSRRRETVRAALYEAGASRIRTAETDAKVETAMEPH